MTNSRENNTLCTFKSSAEINMPLIIEEWKQGQFKKVEKRIDCITHSIFINVKNEGLRSNPIVVETEKYLIKAILTALLEEGGEIDNYKKVRMNNVLKMLGSNYENYFSNVPKENLSQSFYAHFYYCGPRLKVEMWKEAYFWLDNFLKRK